LLNARDALHEVLQRLEKTLVERQRKADDDQQTTDHDEIRKRGEVLIGAWNHDPSDQAEDCQHNRQHHSYQLDHERSHLWERIDVRDRKDKEREQNSNR